MSNITYYLKREDKSFVGIQVKNKIVVSMFNFMLWILLINRTVESLVDCDVIDLCNLLNVLLLAENILKLS